MATESTGDGLAHWPASGVDALFDCSIGDLLTRRARNDGYRVALMWPDGDSLGSMTYGELLRAANSVAHLLANLQHGERVAVWGRNSTEWVLLQYACAMRGLLLTPFNTAWTNVEAAAAADLVEPAVLFAGSDSRGEPIAPRAEAILGNARVRRLDALGELPSAPPAMRAVSPQSPFLIQFTSGTTGRSKGAVLSQHAALNCAYLRLRRDTAAVTLNSVPFHHVGGSISVLLGALSTKGASIVVDRFNPEESIRLLPLAGVTHLGGVPIMVEQLLDQLAKSPGAAPCLSTVALGGASISPALIRRVRKQTGAAVMVTYGQSECPLVTNSDRTDPPELLATTSGRPCEATEVRIVDPSTGNTVRFGETGEIQVRSPMMMSGYYGMPERTAEAISADGFLRTGDLGAMDSDGYLSIRDRVRDVIIRGGENIYPAEVEAALAEYPDVVMCAVVGIADARWGELVGATIVVSGNRPRPADLERFLSERLAHFKIPRIWRTVDALPTTASGKIRRNVVRQQMNALRTPAHH